MVLPHMKRPGKLCWEKCRYTCCRPCHFLEKCCTQEENNSISLSSRTSTTQAVNNPRPSGAAETTRTRIRPEASDTSHIEMIRRVNNRQYNPTINALLENNRARGPNMHNGTSSGSLNPTRQPNRSAGNIWESIDDRRRSSATNEVFTIVVSPPTSSVHTSIVSPPANRDTAEGNKRPDPPPPYADILTPIVAS
ncbi:hypothetical protein PoB_002629800 [Plakobranchus ocellatus]|uniref:Uncharacterized protein n=1 Tax=Plakobranchus ocellatus TaxID=259542 RepID=A0AAV3ZZC7_9GAST|nr:hypothetical protein PoB_002629800 [Plakobranchus ocellatus]